MEKTYQPESIESTWYQHWEGRGYFAPRGSGDPYAIMIPPPNVTGSLHMGHAFQDTLMDTLVRYRRMQGRNTLWQAGTDHAGIATQMLVERKVAHEEQKSRHDLGREAFIERIWEWKQESGDHITHQLRRMGSSIDWSRERFTMDDGFYRAVREAFVRLFDEGLIYRGKRLVNWDPALATAISDLEVENRETDGHMWHFKYPLAGGESYEYIERDADGNVTLREQRDYISIATTRPETMLGDGAVAVNPNDARYAPLVGRLCEIPVGPKAQRRLIPIIEDDYPDPAFGSGAVKITGAHDFNDYAVAQRNAIPLYNLMDRHAHMRSDGLSYAESAALASRAARGEPLDDVAQVNLVPEELRGLDRFEARARVVEAITAEGLAVTVSDEEGRQQPLVESKKIMQPFGDRSGVVIEPWLTDQWFVAVESLAKPAIAAVENGDIQFVPKNYENMYFAWMRDLQDWCISRQLWWGHRIPAWYDENGAFYVARSEEEAREKYGLEPGVALHQDDDVLDTWFSSGLWTFATLGWPQQTPELATFHPTSTLVTGFDIIFFWVARMIMLTLKFTGEVPFKTVYVHGLVRDSQGQKMSKSKGNVLDPIDLIDGIDLESLVEKRTGNMMQPQKAKAITKATRAEFPEGIEPNGTDALRYTFLSLATTGRDIKFDPGRLEGYRNFCNKLWNAARYVLMNTEGEDCGADGEVALSLADRWIISRLQQVERQVTRSLDDYRFDLASQALYDFIWHDYCDWYLELSKPVLWDSEASMAARRGTRRTLVRVLEAILRLAHPMMPFITEEIWQKVSLLAGVDIDHHGSSIMVQPWPVCDAARIDEQAEADIEWLKAVIVAIRNIRAELNIAPGRELALLLTHGDDTDRRRLDDNARFLSRLARLSEVHFAAPEEVPAAAVQRVGSLELHVPLAGLVDRDAELARLDREIGKQEKLMAGVEKKLGNASFTQKAPAEVVEKERGKLDEARASRDTLLAQRRTIEAL
ncbi:valine--tRNA ligase [Kushneria aurantia]|uniref:Valine--tRNA ligase n=1 Tax=Kushneria aurantia TaxID=504092 RepID=A0ABV6G0Y1_9GAMM|nr:valine--tRNA ligase [Kushneria aurantia]